MATSVLFQGKSYQTPGVFVSTDDSALASPSIGASGIVGLIGSCTGGVPYTALSGRSAIRTYSSPTSLAKDFPAGDLLEAANMAFAASQDPAISGGAQFVVPLKANQATQASVTLAGSGGPGIVVSAQAYGFSGNGITASVAPGTTSGVKLTISNGAVTEVGDNLGDEPVGTLSFEPQASGWQAMQAGVAAGGTITATGSLHVTGKSSDLLQSTLSATSAIAIQSAQADAGKVLTLYGLDGSGNGQSEVVSLAAGPQTSGKTYSRLLACSLNTASQDVKLLDNQGILLAELDQDVSSLGLFSGANLAVAGVPANVSASAAGETIVVCGLSPTGSPVVQAIALGTSAAPTPALSSVTAIALGGVNPTHTVTLAAPAVSVPGSPSTPVQQAAGAFQAIPGFAVALNPVDAQTPTSELDAAPTVDVVAGKLAIVSDIQSAVDWAAANSRLVSVSAAPGSVGLPSPTQAPVPLVGGSELPATAADFQACLTLLQQVRVNTVVALSSNPAVAEAVDAHCALMCGAGQSERDGVVGVMNAALTDVPTFAQFTAAASGINSRHTRAVGQAVSLYNSQSVYTEFPPHFLAAIVAGMQAGAGVGVPLTHKTANVLAVRQDTSWSPMGDSEALLSEGCLFFEQKDQIGIRCVRNLTTYVSATNLALQEASVNQCVDYAVYNFRMALEAFVGQRGFSGTVNAAQAASISILQQLIAQTIITSYQTPVISIVSDTMNVAITFSPTLPINFVTANVSVVLPNTFTNAAAS